MGFVKGVRCLSECKSTFFWTVSECAISTVHFCIFLSVNALCLIMHSNIKYLVPKYAIWNTPFNVPALLCIFPSVFCPGSPCDHSHPCVSIRPELYMGSVNGGLINGRDSAQSH